MRNVVRALRALGYRFQIANLSEEEKAVWGNMVASAISSQQVANLLPEETAWWKLQVESESCSHCWFDGQEHCLKHS